MKVEVAKDGSTFDVFVSDPILESVKRLSVEQARELSAKLSKAAAIAEAKNRVNRLQVVS